MELAAPEHLKINVFTFPQLLLIRSILNMQMTKNCTISGMSLNFGHIRPETTELAALECLKIPPY